MDFPRPKARYKYTCRECKGEIAKRERYVDLSGEARCPVHEHCLEDFLSRFTEITLRNAANEYKALVPEPLPTTVQFNGLMYEHLGKGVYVRARHFHITMYTELVTQETDNGN